MKLNEYLIFLLLKFLSCLARKINLQKRVILAQKISSFIYVFAPIRKTTAKNNINRAFPKYSKKMKEHILKKSYTFFMEQFLLFLGFPESYKQYNIRVENKNIFDSNLLKKRGILYITGHFGFWEFVIAWFGKNNYPLTGIAQKQKNKGAHDFFIRQREWSGIKHVFRKDSFNKMNMVLEKGDILGLVSDQDAKDKGVFVNFFNILSSTHKGPARFYKEKGATPIFGVCIKESYNQLFIKFTEIRAENLFDTFSFTQTYSNMLEHEIRRHPEQYFWWHKRWKTQPKH